MEINRTLPLAIDVVIVGRISEAEIKRKLNLNKKSHENLFNFFSSFMFVSSEALITKRFLRKQAKNLTRRKK